MARVVRAPEQRRQELLDRAEELFFTQGYDATPVEQIIGAAGLSKGAFYHHFASKEALLEALADRIVDRHLAHVAGVLEDPSLDGLGRLNAFMAGSRRFNIEVASVVRRTLRVIFRPGNLPLRHRISAATIAKVAPALARILAEGARDGTLDTPDPLATAEMLLQLGTVVHDTIARAIEASERGAHADAAEMLDRRLVLYEVAFNRVLGLQDHAVSLVEPGFAAAVVSSSP